MSGYFKLESKTDRTAVVEIPGWQSNGVVLSEDYIQEMIEDIESLQRHVHGDGNQVAQNLWGSLSALKRQCKRSSMNT
jgi:hypothetical protein